jgi:O-antigen/teichoic acid export membrane protein
MKLRAPSTNPTTTRGGSRAVLGTAATNGGLAVVGLMTGVLAARLLGTEGRGHLAAAQAVGSLLGAVGSLSLGEALVYFVGRGKHSPWVVLKTATLLATASVAVLVSIALLVMPAVLSGQPASIGPARAYSLIGLTFVLLGFPITYVRALQRYGLWNVLRFISPMCWLIALLLFFLVGSRDVLSLVLSFVALQALFIPLAWLLSARLHEDRGPPDSALIRPMLGYGAPLFVATLPHVLNVRLDQLLIANVQTADQLGIYAVSVSWAGLGLPLMGAIGSVLFPKLAALEREKGRAGLGRSSRAGVVIASGIGIVIAVSAPVAVPLLFGESFAVPIVLPVLLAAATAILGVNGIIEEGLRGLGEPRSILVGELTGLAVTILLLFLLLPIWGITGAAVASLGGYGTVCFILAWRTRRQIGLPVSELLVPTKADLQSMGRHGLALVRFRRRVEK